MAKSGRGQGKTFILWKPPSSFSGYTPDNDITACRHANSEMCYRSGVLAVHKENKSYE